MSKLIYFNRLVTEPSFIETKLTDFRQNSYFEQPEKNIVTDSRIEASLRGSFHQYQIETSDSTLIWSNFSSSSRENLEKGPVVN